MYKLVAFFALLAVCAAAPAPKPQFYTPVVVAPVVPAVTSYSSYSSSVVHPPTVPVVHTAQVVPVAYHAPAAYYV